MPPAGADKAAADKADAAARKEAAKFNAAPPPLTSYTADVALAMASAAMAGRQAAAAGPAAAPGVSSAPHAKVAVLPGRWHRFMLGRPGPARRRPAAAMHTSFLTSSANTRTIYGKCSCAHNTRVRNNPLPCLTSTAVKPQDSFLRKAGAARARQLQHERAARADLRPARQEVAPDQRLQHATLAAALAAHDGNLRQVQLEVQRDLRARAPPPSAF